MKRLPKQYADFEDFRLPADFYTQSKPQDIEAFISHPKQASLIDLVKRALELKDLLGPICSLVPQLTF